ncbi:MAG: MBL fold metallo-hydrolase [Proteobacteria bacterium]|nr:MBL fold metallo-hydrolase [Pseudomonadota bacterium]
MTFPHRKEAFTEIYPGIFRTTLPIPGRRPGPVNVYLFQGEINVLVDTGAKHTVHLLKKAFRDLGFDIKTLNQIIATHGHLDHYGAARHLIRCTGGHATLAAHPEDVHAIRTGREVPLGTYKDYFSAMGVPVVLRFLMMPLMFLGKFLADPCRVDLLLNDGDKIRLGNYDATVLSTPGHTRGSVCIYLETEKILLAGDHIIEHITPNAFVMLEKNRFLPQRLSQSEYYASLEKIEALSPELVLTAHGQPVTDIKKIISGYRESFEKRKEKLLGIINGDKKTVYRIARELFPELGGKRFSLDLFLAISETYTHLQVLEREGKIAMEMKQQKLRVENACAA